MTAPAPGSLIASLSRSTIVGGPGAVGGCDVRVTNTGTEAATVHFALDGSAGGWGTVFPAAIDVDAGGSALSRLTFAVPASNRLAGTNHGFVLRVGRGLEHAPIELAGRVDIREVRDLRASITPLVVRARGASTHTVTIENRGTGARRVELDGSSAHGDLDVCLAEGRMTVLPGHVATVEVTVAPRRRSLAGRPRSCPFAVEARPEGGPVLQAQATYFQDPVRWWRGAGVAAAAAVVLAVAGFATSAGGHRPARRVVTAATGPAVPAPPAPACPDEPEPSPARVDLDTFAFCPAVLTVPVGAEVLWVNHDLAPHTVTSDGPDDGFDSGPLGQGQSWSIRFSQPGTYRYTCRFHPGMSGTVVVAG